MPTDPGAAAEAARREAIASLEIAMVEQANNLADTAALMKQALEDRGFATMVAEPAAIQYMWTLGSQFVIARNGLE